MSKQEHFEEWAKARGNQMQTIEGEYACPVTSDQWEAWQAACPEGWQCVPVEPTDEMVNAALDAYTPFGDMELAIQAAVVHAPNPEDV